MWYALPVVGISATNLRYLVNAAGTADERAADATAVPPSDGEKFTYVYNPWGQLVEIKKIGGGSVTNAKYTYSAMGHRISEQLDTNDSSNSGVGDGLVDAYDPVFFIATDFSGRRLATYRGTDSDPKETFIHHDARIRGPVHQGGPILRDRDADLADKPFYWASEPAASDRYERHYYALDYRGNVSAIFASDGTLVEQVRYSATGVPFNIPLGDVNGDGKVEAGTGSDPDWNQIDYMWKTPAYHVRGDLDLDGDVDAADLAIAQARDGTGTGRGYLTLIGAGHRMLLLNLEYGGHYLCTSWSVVSHITVCTSINIKLNGESTAVDPQINHPIPGLPVCLSSEQRQKIDDLLTQIYSACPTLKIRWEWDPNESTSEGSTSPNRIWRCDTTVRIGVAEGWGPGRGHSELECEFLFETIIHELTHVRQLCITYGICDPDKKYHVSFMPGPSILSELDALENNICMEIEAYCGNFPEKCDRDKRPLPAERPSFCATYVCVSVTDPNCQAVCDSTIVDRCVNGRYIPPPGSDFPWWVDLWRGRIRKFW